MKTLEIYLGKDLVTTVYGVASIKHEMGCLTLNDEKEEVKAYFEGDYSFVVVHEDKSQKAVTVYESDVTER